MPNLCVIFDLDGTLVDSETLNSRAFVELIPGITESEADLAVRYRGMKLSEILADIATRYTLDIGEEFEPRYRERVALLYDTHLLENPGVSGLLNGLTYPCCVASSAPYRKIAHALKVTNLSSFFDGNIFSSYDIGSWKPDPGLFLHAASAMGFPSESCVVIEDSIPGVKAGLAAGMHVCHYRGTGEFEGRCRAFTEMSELDAILEAIQCAGQQ